MAATITVCDSCASEIPQIQGDDKDEYSEQALLSSPLTARGRLIEVRDVDPIDRLGDRRSCFGDRILIRNSGGGSDRLDV